MVEGLLVVAVAILVGNYISERLNLMGPLVLIGVGIALSFVPHLPYVGVEPEVVLSVILPLLLFWEAQTIPLRGIKRALRGIVLNSTLMVVFVAAAVGLVGWAVGLTLGTALLIGAAIGPTDATAVTALGKGISRRQMVVLRAESLINDGTALVVFALAMEYMTDASTITAGHAVARFVVSFGGGIVVGLLVGKLTMLVGRFVESSMLTNVFRFVVPLGAYVLAEEIGASGVLAVVVAGLYLARVATRMISMQTRALSRPVWSLLTYILNAVLFLLVGLYLPATVRSLNSDNLPHAVLVTVALYAAMMLARWLFGETVIRMIRLLDRRPSQRLRRTTPYERLVTTTAGFRGAISLAVAFSIPATLPSGAPFPYRDLILFVTSGIVILSLAVQGALLPFAVRLTQRHPNPLTPPPSQDEEEIRQAIVEAAHRVLDAMPDLVEESGASDEVAARVRQGWERKVRLVSTPAEERAATEDSDEAFETEKTLTMGTIQVGRAHIISMRDEGRIDDEALIELMAHYDIEEMRVVGPLRLE